MSEVLARRAEDERIRRAAAIAVGVAAVVGALSALTVGRLLGDSAR